MRKTILDYNLESAGYNNNDVLAIENGMPSFRKSSNVYKRCQMLIQAGKINSIDEVEIIKGRHHQHAHAGYQLAIVKKRSK